jgi:opacity protein-like surface antigen
MNRIFFLLILVIIFVNCIGSYSQSRFSLGPFIGAAVPTGDYSGTTIDYYNGTQYGLGTGIDIGAIFKVKFPFGNLRMSASYSPLKNTGLATSNVPDSYIEVKQSLFTISAGPEFQFKIPQSPVKPYIGADLLMTSFSGAATFLNVPRIDDGTYSMASTTRFGLGVGAGVEFSFNNKYSLDLGLRYNIYNLFGKTYTLNADKRLNSYLYLNDDADPLYATDIAHHPIGSSRSISALNIYLGFLFNL